MHIITWVCPPCSSVSQIIISHAQFQKHFSVQEFQLKSVSFLRYPLKSSFLPLVFCCYFQAYGIFSFRQLAWHLVQRSVIYAVFYRVLLSKDDFPGESISFIFPQLNIEKQQKAQFQETSLQDPTASWCLLAAAPHTKDESLLLSKDSVHNTRRPSWKKDDL